MQLHFLRAPMCKSAQDRYKNMQQRAISHVSKLRTASVECMKFIDLNEIAFCEKLITECSFSNVGIDEPITLLAKFAPTLHRK